MKAADLKSVRVQALVGSNPTLSAKASPRMSDRIKAYWKAALDRLAVAL